MEDGTDVTQRILNITLEILYLLTGEDYIVVKKPGGRTTNNRLQVVEGFCRKQKSVFVPPPRSSPSERSEEKILELTNKITSLLTGEVPIRCQDVTVYFSMEEWEYLEGHKDLYKDVMMDDRPPLTSPGGCENRPDSGDHYFPMVTSDTETDDSMVIDEGPESIHSNEGPGPQGIDPYEEGPGPQDIGTYEEGPGPQRIDPYQEGPGPQGIDQYEDMGPQDIDSYEDMGLEIIYPYHGDMEPEGVDPYEGDTGPEAIDPCIGDPGVQGIDPYEGDTEPKGIDPYEGHTGPKGIDPYEGHTGPKGKDPYEGHTGPKGKDPYEGHTGAKGKDPCKVATTTSSMKGFPVRIKQEPVSDEDDGLAAKNYSNQIAYSCVRIKEEPQMYVEVKIPSEGEDRTPQAYCHIKVETVPAEEDDRSTIDRSTPNIYTSRDQGHSTAALIKESVAFVNVSNVSQQANRTHVQPSNAAAETTTYKVEADKAPEKGSDNSSLYSVRQKEDSMEILYHCPSCFKGFSSNLDLARHQVIHTVSKLFICSLCGKSFTEMSFLVKHQVIHTDLKLCVCPVCGGCFYSETSLAKHQKTHSLPLFCSTCGKCFFNKTELAMHERKHSGERPFGCHVCGKHFIAKSVLNKHMMIHGPMDIAK